MTSACQYVGQVATTKSNKSRRSKKRADIVTGSTSTREQVAMVRELYILYYITLLVVYNIYIYYNDGVQNVYIIAQ